MTDMTQPADSQCFQVPVKENDPRLGHAVQPVNVSKLRELEPGWAIVGYCDSEGVRRNLGRAGAEQGPDAIRSAFYRLSTRPDWPPLYDIGNVAPSKSLEDTHVTVAHVAKSVYPQHRLVALGGGHDFAYPDGMSFLETYAKGDARPLIINVDAHLDVRKPSPAPNSGTPFYQLLESGYEFDLIQFGYQAQANSVFHEEYARARGVTLISFENRREALKVVENIKGTQRPLFISIDIDGFSSNIAPGASAAWPLGLSWDDVEPVLKHLTRHQDLKLIGLYEVAPPLDRDSITSKLAASILYQVLNF